MNVAGVLHLRNDQGVDVLASRFNYGNQILISPRRIQSIHTEAANGIPPVHFIKGCNGILPSLRLHAGSNSVFQIEKHMIYAQTKRLFNLLQGASRHGKLAASTAANFNHGVLLGALTTDNRIRLIYMI
ncbi:hypothetical protein D9M69_574970 [compost metagenome]